MKRKKIIIGNWKMYKNSDETKEFLQQLQSLTKSKDFSCEYGIAASFTNLPSLQNKQLPNLIIAAQNCHFEAEGAYTGEIAIKMLQDVGVSHVIIGHSERRMYFNETDDVINKKVKALLQNNLVPILCCGETLQQYEKHETTKVIQKQLELALANVKGKDISNLVIAYEPIWAIGTGKTATAEQAQIVCQMIREYIAKLYDEKIAQQIRIQYGGSVKPDNIKSLLAQADIDGALVGGASLIAQSFFELLI